MRILTRKAERGGGWVLPFDPGKPKLSRYSLIAIMPFTWTRLRKPGRTRACVFWRRGGRLDGRIQYEFAYSDSYKEQVI